mmetsp:Transcript_26829/g.82363  ORF Transcript_26829/g.82363 Transcript_26829/m.82363 type:complete len:466 (-) Transcript_26829:381-1778(-)
MTRTPRRSTPLFPQQSPTKKRRAKSQEPRTTHRKRRRKNPQNLLLLFGVALFLEGELVLGDEVGLCVAGDLFVGLVLHGELALALGLGAEDGGVAEHVGEGDVGLDGGVGGVVGDFGVGDDAAALVDGAHDVALEFRGDRDLEQHDGFEDDGLRVLDGLADALDHGRAEGHVARVDGVGDAVADGDADALDRGAHEATLDDRLGGALLAARNELGRNVLPDQLVHELERLRSRRLVVVFFRVGVLLVVFEGLDGAHDAGVLPGAAGLLLVDVVEGGALRDGLAVVDARVADVRLDVVLALQALDVDFQVQLAHARENGLLGLGIRVHAQRGVFLREALQRRREVVHGRGRRAFFHGDRERNHGPRHEHGAHRQALVVLLLVAVRGGARFFEGVHGGAVDAEDGHDVAGARGVDFLHLVRVHSHEARDLDLFPRAHVDDLRAFFQGPPIDADVRELAEARLLELEG